MKNEICEYCRFFLFDEEYESGKKVDTDEYEAGKCRRFPPTEYDKVDGTYEHKYVFRDSWCGEFVAKQKIPIPPRVAENYGSPGAKTGGD